MQTLWNRLFNEETGLGTALTALVYHTPYQETYQLLGRTEFWSKEQLQRYQWHQLTELIHHAYTHVPYYKKLFQIRGITPESITSLDDFQRIPFLTKELVQEYRNDLKATNYPASCFEETMTGGSTGFPLHFYVEKGTWFARHLAYINMLLEWANCDAWDKSVLVTGAQKPWEYRPVSRTLVLSSFHLTEQLLPKFYNKIRRFKPNYLIGYPSALTLIARFFQQNEIEFSGLKAVFCYGETIYDWQRTLLEDVFCCRMHSQYGHREQCVLAGTCEKSNDYHVFPQYGFIELIDGKGRPVTKDGECGEIVATGFHTGIFPFIRYRTGDIAVYSSQSCTCKRHYPLLKSIEGRVQDFVISKNRRQVPFMGIHHLVAIVTSNVQECQLYQEAEGEIILHVVKKPEFSDDDATRIKASFSKRFGDEFSLSITAVDSIPRTNRGKYPFLIQKLPIEWSA